MKIIIFIIISSFAGVLSDKWIDPHDMDTNSKRNLRRSRSASLGDVDKYPSTISGVQEDKTTLVYLKRVISLLLNSAVVTGSDTKLRSGKYELKTDSESYKFLSEFVSDQNINVESLRKLDTILSDIFSRNISDDFLNAFSSFQDKLYNVLCNFQSAILLGTFVCLYVVFKLLKSNFSFWYIIRYLLTLILIIDYAFRYRQLYEEAEEHNMKIKFSSKCDVKKMDWGTYLLFLIKQEDCERKLVTPLEVALLQLKHIIIIPMTALGTGMGQLANNLWVQLPWPWNLVIFPVMLLFCLLIYAITTVAASGSPFKINLFHLFHFDFGQRNEGGNRISGPTLDRLLDAFGPTQRPLLEDTRSSPEKTTIKKKSRKTAFTQRNSKEGFQKIQSAEFNSHEIKSNSPKKGIIKEEPKQTNENASHSTSEVPSKERKKSV
ncbi:hypothetical protein JTB14_003296 [Gonioctena quinquepunctata]|nr:hypothetical protein JTB14_003296 [Gonioctena quinquepunctata]